MSESMKTTLNELCQKDIATASDAELYTALLKLVQEQSQKQIKPVTGRKLYYISAEFLIGKLLSNNLINLGLYDEVRETLASVGKSLADIEEQEPEPSLGNGGLGRLAACFLDSLATLDLPGDGVGLRYHCGLFHQNFKNNIQNEAPDFWLTDQCAAKATDTVFPVSLAGNTYSARLYKLPVTGYEGRTNMLNLFDLDSVDESVIGDGISFDKKDIARNLTLFLYPDDSDEDGRLQALLADADDAELEVDVAALNEEHVQERRQHYEHEQGANSPDGLEQRDAARGVEAHDEQGRHRQRQGRRRAEHRRHEHEGQDELHPGIHGVNERVLGPVLADDGAIRHRRHHPR